MTNLICDLIQNKTETQVNSKKNNFTQNTGQDSFNNILDGINKSKQNLQKNTNEQNTADKKSDVNKKENKEYTQSTNDKNQPRNVVNNFEKDETNNTNNIEMKSSETKKDNTISDDNSKSLEKENTKIDETKTDDSEKNTSDTQDKETDTEKSEKSADDTTKLLDKLSDNTQKSAEKNAYDAVNEMLCPTDINTEQKEAPAEENNENIDFKQTEQTSEVISKINLSSTIENTNKFQTNNTISNDFDTSKPELDELSQEIKEEIDIIDSQQESEDSETIKIKVSNDSSIDINKKAEINKSDNLKTDDSVLNQDMVDELDAELTDMGQDSDNDFSNKQNASEQVVKLSIEPVNNSVSSDFSTLTGIDKIKAQNVQNPSALNPSNVKDLNQVDILNQINEKMSQVKTGTSEKVEIILKPENLGKVNIEIQSDKGSISATIIAESKQVKELLEKNIDSLKNNFASQGLNLNSVNVKVEETNKSSFNDLNFNQQFNSENNEDNKKNNNAQQIYKDNSNLTFDFDSAEDIDNTALQKVLGNEESLHAGMVDYKV